MSNVPTPLVIYTPDPKSSEPLPAHYLNLPGVVVYAGVTHTRPCGRCGESWGQHGWVVTSSNSLDEIDCAVQPRSVARTGFFPA